MVCWTCWLLTCSLTTNRTVNKQYRIADFWQQLSNLYDNKGRLHYCGLPLLHLAKTNLNQLPAHLKKQIDDLNKRPNDDLLEKTYDTPHFRMHYTLNSNEHKPIGKWTNPKEVEEWVYRLAMYCEMAYEKFIVERCYDLPPTDGSKGGGNDLFDVYVKNIGDKVLGLTAADGPAATNGYQAVTYMFIDNNVSYKNTKGANDLKAVAAHEFFHIIQNGYYGSRLAAEPNHMVSVAKSVALREGTAVWAESVPFKTKRLELHNKRYFTYFDVLPSIWSHPNKHLLSNEQNETSLYAYSTVFFWRYLSEQFGDEIIEKIWAANKEQPTNKSNIEQELLVLDEVLKPYKKMNEVMGLFWGAVCLLQSKTTDYLTYQKKYPELTFKYGQAYQKYLSSRNKKMPTFTVSLQETALANALKKTLQQQLLLDLKSVAAACVYEVKIPPPTCASYTIVVKPAKGTENVLPSDLNVLLLHENVQEHKISYSYQQLTETTNRLNFNVNNNPTTKTKVIAYRLTSPNKSQALLTTSMRFEVQLLVDKTNNKGVHGLQVQELFCDEEEDNLIEIPNNRVLTRGKIKILPQTNGNVYNK